MCMPHASHVSMRRTAAPAEGEDSVIQKGGYVHQILPENPNTYLLFRELCFVSGKEALNCGARR